MIKCPNCSAELSFDAKSQSVTCEYCGSTFNPNDLKEKKASKAKKVNNDSIQAKSYLCQSCGAQLLTFDDTAVTFCSYCGSENMLEDKLIDLNKPEFVIPFKITKDQCIEIFNNKIKGYFFLPKYMKNNLVLEKVRGIYMPYAIYTLSHKGYSTNKGSKFWKRVGNYDYYKDYSLTADIDAKVEGISYDLVSTFYDEYSQAISPYDMKDAKEFNLSYLSGYYADALDVNQELYEKEAIDIAEKYTRDELIKDSRYNAYGCYDPKVSMSVEKISNGMFPVYFLAFRDEKNNRINYAVINGQTGEIAMDKPIDFKKYILTSLGFSVILFLILNTFSEITFSMLAYLCNFLSVVNIIITVIQNKKLKGREDLSDDKGYANSKAFDKDKKQSRKFSTFIIVLSQLICIFLAIIVVAGEFVDDEIYYGLCIVMFLISAISYMGLMKRQNLLSTREIPQLNKRGGTKSEK